MHNKTIIGLSFCDMQNYMLKISAEIISPFLTRIFNLCIKTGVYIDDWKKAWVVPIYKSENRKKWENYRPISILPIITKIFERSVFLNINLDFAQKILLWQHSSKRVILGMRIWTMTN